MIPVTYIAMGVIIKGLNIKFKLLGLFISLTHKEFQMVLVDVGSLVSI